MPRGECIPGVDEEQITHAQGGEIQDPGLTSVNYSRQVVYRRHEGGMGAALHSALLCVCVG